MQEADEGIFLFLLKGFRAHLHHGVVDQRSQRLHQVAAEVEGVVNIVVEDAQLRQIARRRDLAVERGEDDAVAVVERRVFRDGQRPGELLAKKRVEVHLRGVALAVAGVAQLQLLKVARQKRLLRPFPTAQHVALAGDLGANDLRPHRCLRRLRPAHLLADAGGGIVAAAGGQQFPAGVALPVAEDDLYLVGEQFAQGVPVGKAPISIIKQYIESQKRSE